MQRIWKRPRMRSCLRIFGATLMIGLTGAAEASGQEAADSVAVATDADGFRLFYGPTAAKPQIDDTARLPFVALGDDFQMGLGIRLGIGYQTRDLELAGTAEYAGLDVGDPFERNGIDMGRRSSILRAYVLSLWWSPPALEYGEYRGRVGLGYLGSGLDNVMVDPTQLNEELRGFVREVQETDEEQPTGISGTGFRVGAGVERDFSPTLALQAHLEADFLDYRTFIFDMERFRWDGGSGWIPRLAVVLRWAP